MVLVSAFFKNHLRLARILIKLIVGFKRRSNGFQHHRIILYSNVLKRNLLCIFLNFLQPAVTHQPAGVWHIMLARIDIVTAGRSVGQAVCTSFDKRIHRLIIGHNPARINCFRDPVVEEKLISGSVDDSAIRLKDKRLCIRMRCQLNAADRLSKVFVLHLAQRLLISMKSHHAVLFVIADGQTGNILRQTQVHAILRKGRNWD